MSPLRGILALMCLVHFTSAWTTQPFRDAPNNQFTAQAFLTPSSPLHAATPYPAGPNASAAMMESFQPLGDLSILNKDGYTALSHPLFPQYGVRMKRTEFKCDTRVRSYTGYIDIEARHLFFYFFESRTNPSTDDVIFWTNGGPGCSSSLGLFMELGMPSFPHFFLSFNILIPALYFLPLIYENALLGPCRIQDEEGPKYHSRSWNTNANLIFVDQPVGVGFSYADHGESVSRTEEAAKDIAAFVAIFFENFSQFKGRGFHMAGESYGGRYIPLFASAVYDQNTALVEAGLTPVNLQSVMIGNGVTDLRENFLSLYPITCTPSSLSPVLSIAECTTIKATLDRCDRWMRENCEEQLDIVNCGATALFCIEVFTKGYVERNLNPYDMSKKCEGSRSETMCYPITKHITNYLSQPSVWHSLGVDPQAQKPFKSCSNEVDQAFARAGDILYPTSGYVSALLERGVRVLIYAGTYDWTCNWIGNERWTAKLDWSGKDAFASQPLREWSVLGTKAGLTRSAKGFTFATIYGAGHMVPYDKPVESLALVQRWLAKQDL